MSTRLRTVRESLQLLRKMDKETSVTEYFIRALCKSGKITTVTIGQKVLLNYDELLEFLHISDTQ